MGENTRIRPITRGDRKRLHAVYIVFIAAASRPLSYICSTVTPMNCFPAGFPIKKCASQRSLVAVICYLAVAALPSIAGLPPIATDEKILFSEEFDDNNNKWTNIATVNGAGRPLTKRAGMTNSLWSPSYPGNGEIVQSDCILPKIINLADGPVSLHASVCTNNIDGTDGSRIEITLKEAGKNNSITYLVRPAINGFIKFRDAGWEMRLVSMARTARVFNADDAFRALKLTLSAGSRPGVATAEVFYYDDAEEAYVSLGKVGDLISLKTGRIGGIQILSRNADGVASFDSLVVTQGGK
jgi:hypothetical protein